MDVHLASPDYCQFLLPCAPHFALLVLTLVLTITADFHRWGSREWSSQLLDVSPGPPEFGRAENVQLIDCPGLDSPGTIHFEMVLETGLEESDIVCTEKGIVHLIDITAFLTIPQTDVAARLGMSASSFSKRWKVAAQGRKWPHRSVARIDLQINALLLSVPDEDVESGKLPADVEERVTKLLYERAFNLQPVSIRQ
jgi:hypothetical protein